MKVLLFSCNRALQAHGTLKSLQLNCTDFSCFDITVYYKASSPKHQRTYEMLLQEFASAKNITFIQEKKFYADIMQILFGMATSRFQAWIGLFILRRREPQSFNGKYVLFIVDDCLFVKNFSIRKITHLLEKLPHALGFSLRLGMNTTFCYPLERPQKAPLFQNVENSIVSFFWPAADGDFGYPFDLSSSVYRLQDIYSICINSYFSNPNIMEHELDKQRSRFKKRRNTMLCFQKSVAFCNPVNRVQNIVPNRCGNLPEDSADHLVDLFLEGYRLKVAAYQGLEVAACHQEIALELTSPQVVPTTS